MNIESLKELGGKEWIVGEKHRVYFNNLDELFGLNCRFYLSGNVQQATLDGEEISNGRATEILYSLREGRLWFDVVSEKWAFSFTDCRDFTGHEMGSYIVDEIERRVAKLTAKE